MKKIPIALMALIVSLGCTVDKRDSADTSNGIDTETEMVVDSLLYFRHHSGETDILSRRFPDISRNKAIAIQLAMLEKELEAGARQIGWKMAGTVADDSANYDPMFGYVLDSNVIEEDSLLSTKNFPGGRVMVEGEIGFVMNRNFKNGADSIEEVKEGVDYVINAVEFAQATAIPVNGDPATLNINHILASGMGHTGLMPGSGRSDIQEFDMENETVQCFIDGQLVAEGVSSNVYGGPLNALYSLVNMLPKYGTYLKKGDIVVTGSVYDNPTIDGTANVRLEFSSLGSIHFRMK